MPRLDAAEWRALVDIELDDGTLRVSDRDVVMDDGTYYEGRLRSIPALHTGLGRVIDPQPVLPDVRLELSDEDQVLLDRTETTEWANRDVVIRLGAGLDLTAYAVVFRGRISFNGIESDDVSLTVEATDEQADLEISLPPNRITAAVYPHAEDKAIGKMIPLVWGDWQTTAGNGEALPAYQLDSTEGTGGRFTIADHALKSIEAVYLDGAPAAFTADLANGEFVLNVAYAPATETVTVHCEGATHDGATTGTLLQSIPELFVDLLWTWCAIPAANIDLTAVTAWEEELDPILYGRRWVGEQTTGARLSVELITEGFADLPIKEGVFSPVYRVTPAAGLDTFDAADLPPVQLAVQTGSDLQGSLRDFRIIQDPDQAFCTRVTALGCWAPLLAEYQEAYDTVDTPAEARYRTQRARTVTLNWIYLRSGVIDRATRELYTYSAIPESVDALFAPAAVEKIPGEKFRLIYSKFPDDDDGTPMQVRQQFIRFDPFTVRLVAWNILKLIAEARWSADVELTWAEARALDDTYGALWPAWAADEATTWLTATASERLLYGFWTDDDGYADTSVIPDPASQHYRWSGESAWLTRTNGFWTDDDGYADATSPPDPASRRYRWM